jgi:hypothetical protein
LRQLRLLFALWVVMFCPLGAAAPTLMTVDFIADSERTNFNGFEVLPSATRLGTVYVGDGIRVEQVNPSSSLIWTTNPVEGFEGTRSWYPNGGDAGYTRITLAGDVDFAAVGFLRGSGGGPAAWQGGPPPYNTLHYELFNDGALVLSGTLENERSASYLGFQGDVFDEVRVWEQVAEGYCVVGRCNALAIDSIEVIGAGPVEHIDILPINYSPPTPTPVTEVAEPGTPSLVLVGLLIGASLVQRSRAGRRRYGGPAHAS